MNIEDYKIKCIGRIFSLSELVVMYNDCATFNFFKNRDINEARIVMYDKLFASGSHIVITDIIDLRSFISSRTVEIRISKPNLMEKVFKFKYSRSIKYNITLLLCKSINYKQYQSEEDLYNRTQIYFNYGSQLYLMLKNNDKKEEIIYKIKTAMSYYFCRRDTFVEHNFLKIINLYDDMQLEISSVCKGIIIVRVNNSSKRLTLFLEKSLIGILNYLAIINKIHKKLSSD